MSSSQLKHYLTDTIGAMVSGLAGMAIVYAAKMCEDDQLLGGFLLYSIPIASIFICKLIEFILGMSVTRMEQKFVNKHTRAMENNSRARQIDALKHQQESFRQEFESKNEWITDAEQKKLFSKEQADILRRDLQASAFASLSKTFD